MLRLPCRRKAIPLQIVVGQKAASCQLTPCLSRVLLCHDIEASDNNGNWNRGIPCPGHTGGTNTQAPGYCFDQRATGYGPDSVTGHRLSSVGSNFIGCSCNTCDSQTSYQPFRTDGENMPSYARHG